MTDLTQFQTQNLFLLVGTNPLPNYVAAKLLAKLTGTLYLVHSQDTYEIARRLVACLDQTNHEFIEVDDSDPTSIFEKVQKYAHGKHGVGLNYTGGTKVMAVHAYRAVQENPAAILSYLDARELSMVLQVNSAFSQEYIGQSLHIPIETLLQMHGYGYVFGNSGSDATQTQHLSEVAIGLARVDCKEFRNWCGNLRDEKGNLKKKDKDLDSIELPQLPLWQGCERLGELKPKWNMQLKHIAEWLDGKWLELYVLNTIQQLRTECNLYDPVANLKPPERDLEFDVAVMRGYQLFALSCTTANNRGLIKSKLFEAYIRARQMGGDEARIGIVSCAPANDPDLSRLPQSIQAEVEEGWDAAGKIRVFGAEHLPNLSDWLKDWFNSQP